MNRQEVLDLYFLAARHQLIELAAFLDRMDRAEGPEDFRMQRLRTAMGHLHAKKGKRARSILLALSDPTQTPAMAAGTKGACGAWSKTVPVRRQSHRAKHS